MQFGRTNDAEVDIMLKAAEIDEHYVDFVKTVMFIFRVVTQAVLVENSEPLLLQIGWKRLHGSVGFQLYHRTLYYVTSY